MDPTAPMPVRDRGVALGSLPAEAVDALLAVAGPDAPAPLAMVEIRLLGGAGGRRPEVDNAVAGRDAAFSVFTVGAPFGPPVEAVRAATAAVVASVDAWACGGLLNLLGEGTSDGIGQIWDEAQRARLLAVRDRVDPTGVFATHVVLR
jgi:hypothetical protein